MKRFYIGSVSLIIGLVLTSLFLSPKEVFAQTASLSLSPASGTFNKGCTFSLNVELNTGSTQTDGTDAILFYDPTRLKATKINAGKIYTDYPGNAIDDANGRITVSGLSSLGTPFSGSGTFASLDFMVLDDAPSGATQVRFDFDPGDVGKTTDSNVVERTTIADVLSQVVNGNYVIGEGSCSSSGIIPGGVKPTVPIGAPDGTGGTVVPTKAFLDNSGDINMTVLLGGAGLTLTLLALLGLSLI